VKFVACHFPCNGRYFPIDKVLDVGKMHLILKLLGMNNNYERDDLLGKNPSRKHLDPEGLENEVSNRSTQGDVDDLYILRGDSL